MASIAKTKVVLIHGSHKEFVPHSDPKLAAEGKGSAKTHQPGAELELHPAELARLDPQFRNGLGERFASPEKAAKLKMKQELEAELETDEDELADESEDDKGAKKSDDKGAKK